MHQNIGNILRTFDFEDLTDEDPWSGIFSALLFSIRTTVSTTTEKSPMQLVYGIDAILNIKHTTNWKRIKTRNKNALHKTI